MEKSENVPAVSEGKWIPCSERLPDNPIPDAFYGLSEIEAYPEYIVMIAGAEEPTFLKYMGNGEWYIDGEFYKVIAWQPLPDPYKPVSEGQVE